MKNTIEVNISKEMINALLSIIASAESGKGNHNHYQALECKAILIEWLESMGEIIKH